MVVGSLDDSIGSLEREAPQISGANVAVTDEMKELKEFRDGKKSKDIGLSIKSLSVKNLENMSNNKP